ncbi:MAG: capsular biosynthesis protein [Candidatus Cloacimonetes bacterium]|nr:capsular biosynthesis protein [Candidatus Cloacimonadota bacterium]
MIDIHTHLLPGCDDGSPNLETSISHLRDISTSSVREVILTPHYFPGIYNQDLQALQNIFLDLKKELITNDINLGLHLGAEVYLEHLDCEDMPLQKLVIQGTDYILFETNMGKLPPKLKSILYKMLRMGFKPIMAHPERYAYIFNNPENAEDFIHLSIYLQINAGSLLGLYGKKIAKAAWILLNKGYAHFIASDDHASKDNYSLALAEHPVRSRIDNYTWELLTDANPRLMLANQKIDFFYVKNITERKSLISSIIEKLF